MTRYQLDWHVNLAKQKHVIRSESRTCHQCFSLLSKEYPDINLDQLYFAQESALLTEHLDLLGSQS
ncbi:hypothetical protein HanRHA438_Chr06g0270191 [Helianthus annuus]|nr:hypothetical protein HanRHA438_Chr06g0270191 [Helianthus annuus]